MASVMVAHMSEAPPRVTELNAELPVGLNDIIAKGMSKSRDDRYAACGEMIDAAREVIAGRADGAGGTQVAGAGFPETVAAPGARGDLAPGQPSGDYPAGGSRRGRARTPSTPDSRDGPPPPVRASPRIRTNSPGTNNSSRVGPGSPLTPARPPGGVSPRGRRLGRRNSSNSRGPSSRSRGPSSSSSRGPRSRAAGTSSRDGPHLRSARVGSHHGGSAPSSVASPFCSSSSS
jgi:hypothetical protein